MAGHRLVDRVVDHLVDQVVQAADGGVADVHAGPFADVLQVAEVFQVLGGVIAFALHARGGVQFGIRRGGITGGGVGNGLVGRGGLVIGLGIGIGIGGHEELFACVERSVETRRDHTGTAIAQGN